MAAYAALVSVLHTIEQIQHHPHPPISLDRTQVESLSEKITCLQEFLEGYSMHVGYTKEADPLEMRIADAAYAAEDVIESHITDKILAASTSHREDFSSGDESYYEDGTSYNQEIIPGELISSIDLYQDLQKVIEKMEFIKIEVMDIKEMMGAHAQPQRNLRPSDSFRSSSSTQNPMVGFDDILLKIMDTLIRGKPCREIIPIVGMGGIGKTTLVRSIYHNRRVLEHFTIHAWATISQRYKIKDILLGLLQEDLESEGQRDECEFLGGELHKKLWDRRYLIIVDDVWDVEPWNQIRRFFPDQNNGSRVVITTRLSNLASDVATHGGINMAFLDEESSWDLFCRTVFGEEGCPLELKETGSTIVESCGGLPLSIVVVGGLLKKSDHRREYWEYIGENLISVVNSEDNDKCLKLLYMSYSQLPVDLKPCFLYMGVFSGYKEILVSELFEMWVCEGFLKPNRGKSLEEIAKEYLKELIDRNLVSVHELGSTGNVKYCNIHDLLRDLCWREAQKERFYNVITEHSLNVQEDVSTQWRVVISDSARRREVIKALNYKPLARSLICDSMRILPLHNFRMLRLMSCPKFDYSDYLEDLFRLVNLRYLVLNARWSSKIPSSVHLLWNLHTLIVHIGEETGPFDIWNMSQLRHLEFVRGVYLLDPPSESGIVVLENLQTLGMIMNFKWCEEVIKRMPNIKKLKVDYYEYEEGGSSDYCLNNLERLDKLESLHWQQPCPRDSDIMDNLTFPHSLKRLTLDIWHVHWEDMLEKAGLLPLLEKLKLVGGSFGGDKWETVEGHFPNLKFLQMERCRNLKVWTTESSHFPTLERLVLVQLEELKEIPPKIGEILTLQTIKLVQCSASVANSAKEILNKQEESSGEVSIQVRVSTWNFEQKEELRSLASSNFQIL